MFERTLSDLIRGLRASSKKDEAKFIALAVEEIRKEVSSKDMELKAAAVLKLTYVRSSYLQLNNQCLLVAEGILHSSICLGMTCHGPHSTSLRSCPPHDCISKQSGTLLLYNLLRKIRTS